MFEANLHILVLNSVNVLEIPLTNKHSRTYLAPVFVQEAIRGKEIRASIRHILDNAIDIVVYGSVIGRIK
jgi:hypothetical protein